VTHHLGPTPLGRRTQTTAQSFLPGSVYLGRSHSSFSLFFFFCFVLFYFPFPFLSSSFSRRLLVHKSRQNQKKSPECQPMAQMAAKYKESKLSPRPCANSQEITMESMRVLPVERSSPKYTHIWIFFTFAFTHHHDVGRFRLIRGDLIKSDTLDISTPSSFEFSNSSGQCWNQRTLEGQVRWVEGQADSLGSSPKAFGGG
jgi:hypothetical protein